MKLVGIDYLSIEKYMHPGAPVHHILISAGILIVEGLSLSDAPPGPCRIYCLPMKIKGGDGAPPFFCGPVAYGWVFRWLLDLRSKTAH